MTSSMSTNIDDLPDPNLIPITTPSIHMTIPTTSSEIDIQQKKNRL